MTTLADVLMGKIAPPDGEVVDRGAFLPLGTYRRPDGTETTSLAFPQPMRDGLDALAYALGYRQDPNAPGGYVTQHALNRGGQGLAESATVGSLAARAPAGALRSGMTRSPNELPGLQNLRDTMMGQGSGADRVSAVAQRNAEIRATNEPADGTRIGEYIVEIARQRGLFPDGAPAIAVERTPSKFTDPGLTVRSDVGQVVGTAGADPQIKSSYVASQAAGQGRGSELYRAWAEEVGRPFRSDGTVSSDAAVMYEQMFPKYGYNVLKNPYARNDGGFNGGAWFSNDPSAPTHVYRVEPPGMNSTEFYANPLAGAVPLAFPAPDDQRRQMLVRHLMQGGA